jgi:hypothetical protein
VISIIIIIIIYRELGAVRVLNNIGGGAAPETGIDTVWL